MKFDLHIHSCLSPCASLEMSPSGIVERAVAAGMDGIALTDHQSARNTPAIAECAKRAGLKCLYGLEVCTAEEVHTLALFDTVAQALEMTEWVYAALPKRVSIVKTCSLIMGCSSHPAAARAESCSIECLNVQKEPQNA